LGVGFWLPAQMYPDQYHFTTATYFNIVGTQYVFKVSIAILATPLIYLGHNVIVKILGHGEAHAILEETVRHSLGEDYDAKK
jgi:queuosine precursor transporter